jgi:intracellular sulfur oxidation DsrE/DsrF family protein
MTDQFRDRRALVGLGAGVAAAAFSAVASQAQTAASEGAWRPAFEPQDAWLDRPGTRHRLVFDTTTAKAAETAMFYGDNFYIANKTGYGLEADALGVVIVLRHMSTPLGYNDAVWAKYGAAFADQLELKGKAAIDAAHGNPFNIPGPKESPKQEDVTLATLAKRGVRFAVCGMATDAIAGLIATKTGQKADAVTAEFKANLIPGGVIVSAGILAVNRAQEHGYAFATTG